MISCGEDFLGVLPIFHTKWPEHIFHSCHLQIGQLLSDKVEKEIGKWVPVTFLSQSRRNLRLGLTFIYFFSPFKYINLPQLMAAPDKVAMESAPSKRQISDRLSVIRCLQLPGRKRLQALPADTKHLNYTGLWKFFNLPHLPKGKGILAKLTFYQTVSDSFRAGCWGTGDIFTPLGSDMRGPAPGQSSPIPHSPGCFFRYREKCK